VLVTPCMGKEPCQRVGCGLTEACISGIIGRGTVSGKGYLLWIWCAAALTDVLCSADLFCCPCCVWLCDVSCLQSLQLHKPLMV
jgi:hypothetical protein